MRVGKLKNGKATGNDEITGEMIKGGGDRVVDWILCLKSGDLLCLFYIYKGKGERSECKNYKGISC